MLRRPRELADDVAVGEVQDPVAGLAVMVNIGVGTTADVDVLDRCVGESLKAAELVLKGQFGRMAALTGNDITSAPLAEAVIAQKRLDLKYYEEAQEWFMGAV